MSLTLAVAAAAALSLGSGSDTTIAVRPGTELQVADFAGEVNVRTWARSAVRIEVDAPGRDKVIVQELEGVLLVKAYSRRSHPHTVDLTITAPLWIDLNISGIHTDVTIEGARGAVRVETVHGDIVVVGGRGKIELNAVNEDIRLTDASGTILSQTVNGDLTLQRIASDSVDVSSVNGEIFYEGTIRDRGVYRFTSHNGDISVALPKSASATVSVSTFSGDFDSGFPVTLSETKPGRRYCFTLGKGSARVELESFQGTIHVFRPGAREPGAEQGDGDPGEEDDAGDEDGN